MTISDVQVLWHQSLFDEYGVGKMSFLTEKNESPEAFPSFSPKGIKVGEKVSTCCYIMGYFEKRTSVPQKNVSDESFFIKC